MKLLISVENLDNLSGRAEVPCECEICGKKYPVTKNTVLRGLKGTRSVRFCGRVCAGKNRITKTNCACQQCQKSFKRIPSQIKRVTKIFCSQSCATTFNNQHKIKGTRRSKLEVFIENELTELYPNLEIHYNCKDTINSELDFYIPSLKLAIELNGIFHYEPIFGKDKLGQIQNNDSRKFQACLERDIELCIIDSSSLKYFKPANAQKYLDIIITIIVNKLKMSPQSGSNRQHPYYK